MKNLKKKVEGHKSNLYTAILQYEANDVGHEGHDQVLAHLPQAEVVQWRLYIVQCTLGHYLEKPRG